MNNIALERAAKLGAALQQRRWTLATAESCTGGLIGAHITAIAGSSAHYLGGIISYSNAVKIAQLGVPATIIDTAGAVSAECAAAMVEGVRERLGADLAIATTGIAGPGGGSINKPVGLVFIALATADTTQVVRHVFAGDRQTIQHSAVQAALALLLDHLITSGTSLN